MYNSYSPDKLSTLAELARLPPWSPQPGGPRPQMHVWKCDAYDDHGADADRAHRHDTIMFVWNGVRDLADPGAVARAALYDELAQNSFTCRCGCGGRFNSRPLPDRFEHNGPVVAGTSYQGGFMIAALFERQREMEDRIARSLEAVVEMYKRQTAPTEVPMKDQNVQLLGARPSMLQAAGAEATDAAWRTASKQFLRLARDPLVALLARNLAPGDKRARARISKFLSTEAGESMLSAMLGAALLAVPTGQFGAAPARLGRELRVGAMANGADALAEVVMGPLRAVLASGLLGNAAAISVLGDGGDRITESVSDDVAEKAAIAR